MWIVGMWNFQDTFETRKRSFITAFSTYMTVPSKEPGTVFVEFKKELKIVTHTEPGLTTAEYLSMETMFKGKER